MRAIRRRTGLLAGAGLLVTGLLPIAAAVPASAGTATLPRWRVSYVSPNNSSSFAGIAALSGRDVWAAGSVQPNGPLTGDRPILRHWDGKSWRSVALPAKFAHAVLFTVAASSPSDVWVFGQWRDSQGLDGHAFALRWTGSWSVAGFWKTYGQISGAAVFGQKNAWIFGGAGVRHYNGHGWTKFTLPYSLSAASAVSATDIWAVGSDASRTPVLSRWHGGTWTVQPLPPISSSPPGPSLLGILARSDTNIWLAGGTVTGTGGLRPLALHLSAGVWTATAVPGADQLQQIVPDGHGGQWASYAGPFDASRAEHYTGGGWHTVRLPALTGKATSANYLAQVPRSATVYAAGSTVFGGLPDTNALVLKYSR